MLGIGVLLGAGKRFTLHWRPDRSAAYVAALEANSDIQGHFKQAVVKKDLEKACCLLQSLVVHAAGEPGVDMTRTQSTRTPQAQSGGRTGPSLVL